MFTHRSSRLLRTQWQLYSGLRHVAAQRGPVWRQARHFHASGNLQVVKPVLLADIGEGKRRVSRQKYVPEFLC